MTGFRVRNLRIGRARPFGLQGQSPDIDKQCVGIDDGTERRLNGRSSE